MADPGLFLLLLDFAFIGALPRVFFRADGRLNARWWLTALPFGLCPLFVVAATALRWEPAAPESWLPGLRLAAVALSAASVALIGMALGTHRIPVALWHQDDDAPREIVTYGAYRRIRHPFYAAFLLAFAAAVAHFPHGVTLAALGYALAALNATASREERRLGSSEFGAEYRRYSAVTGRFLPTRGKAPAAGTTRIGG